MAFYREAAGLAAEPAELAHCLRHVGDLARETGDAETARAALDEAERLYRGEVDDRLGLANTVRLRALLDDDKARWRDARALYMIAAGDGWDLADALAECDRHLG
ncbi:hypothetical protein OF829_02785 [Sphingomonas sp. LB-2]|uniref:hypothetical protein n=1 Tax=Sphingomonas caeni TaxID=2984949 RepID=UPI00223061B4|nr:hypothetical protein [Sphingomonas caeni]MCW3846148.1 hypothetical protein [Sphingomonas caeni]